ncbi:MAG: hypothetical protein CM15mP12_3080 [Gammaproteobacteria bacterium]|nr:MAG: hypothetical protein CM15mP12_3080 [Gammaproteobacteria bacterium]
MLLISRDFWTLQVFKVNGFTILNKNVLVLMSLFLENVKAEIVMGDEYPPTKKGRGF